MGQRNDLAEKKKVMIDGVEIQGLLNVQEIELTKGELQVPEFSKIRLIQNGMTTIPAIQLTYKIQRDTGTLQFMKDWFLKDESKDITVIRTDASGAEFARTLLPQSEAVGYFEPPYDAATPTFAQVRITIAPWDVIPIEAS